MPIVARPDHVAAAVPDVEAALERWRDRLGGVVGWDFDNPAVFRGMTLLFNGGTKLELLAPSVAEQRVRSTGGPSGFVGAFLDRFGSRVHHVTLKVPDLEAALHTLSHHDLEAVDVDLSDPHWQEAFLRPSDVGGMIVQLATTDRDDAEWARSEGNVLPDVPTTGGVLRGPTLTSPDLSRAAWIWSQLGATVDADGDDALLASWPGEPLDVRVIRGDRAEAVGVRVSGVDPRPQDPRLGPAVLPG